MKDDVGRNFLPNSSTFLYTFRLGTVTVNVRLPLFFRVDSWGSNSAGSHPSKVCRRTVVLILFPSKESFQESSSTNRARIKRGP